MEPLKIIFSSRLVALIGSHVKRVHPPFDEQDFTAAVGARLEGLELMARAQLIADELARRLPGSTPERSEILSAILHPYVDGRDHELGSNAKGIRGWGTIPLSLIAGQRGLDDFEGSLDLLKEMTSRFSSEFGIRYPLLHDQSRAIEQMAPWVSDPCHHVRRLVSEGLRPRLPWAKQLPQLIKDPSPALPLLTSLRDDESEYVRRSVANHLNDISKDHPDLVGEIAKDWWDEASPARSKLLRHACRSLVKNSHVESLSVLGFECPKLEVGKVAITPRKIKLGESVEVKASILSRGRRTQNLAIDCVVWHQKANGAHTPKVFKGGKVELKPGECVHFQKRLAFRPITTRRYYTGHHFVALRINGEDFDKVRFWLDVAGS